MENMKPYILVESRFSESLEKMVADYMAKGYAVSGGISTSWCGENVWYVQAMVFTGKYTIYPIADNLKSLKLSDALFHKLHLLGIETLEQLCKYSEVDLLKTPDLNKRNLTEIKKALEVFKLSLMSF